MFDGVPFYTDSGARESGRRTVVHEYPKSDRCYAEDMGQRAIEFTVRAYVIAYVNDTANPQTGLRYRDYRIGRDRLQTRLDAGGEGILQLPNMARAGIYGPLTMNVVCTRYRMTEEDRFGGYVTFDMTFVEFGTAPQPTIATQNRVTNAMTNGMNSATTNLNDGVPLEGE